MVKSMGLVFTTTRTVIAMKAIGKKARSKAKASLNMLLEPSTKESGYPTKHTEQE